MACIKTGVVLRKRNYDPHDYGLADSGGQLDTLYGDLHLIGNACVLIYPPVQVMWGTTHGWINLEYGLNMISVRSLPSRVIVIPASRITLRRAALHPSDLLIFQQAGGTIDNTPGEQG